MNDNFVTPIIKITDCCNYNCQFCYYAQKKRSLANSIMPIELLKEIICSVVEVNRLQKRNKTHLIFHGGEPLLAGLSYFQEIMAFESEIIVKYPDISFENSIETNGYLLNDTWIEFFRDNNYGVGISIDGPAEMNYHKRFLHDVESSRVHRRQVAVRLLHCHQQCRHRSPLLSGADDGVLHGAPPLSANVSIKNPRRARNALRG